MRCHLEDRFIKVLATGFGSGLAPFMPGTAGTFVGIPLYMVFSFFPWPLYLVSLAAFFFLAVLVSQEAERIYDIEDPSCVVIDEMVGLLFTMFLVRPTLFHVAAGFVLFRFFDILKPFPIRWVERTLPGGYGVVADDAAAGIYANIVLMLSIHFFGI